jgi:hypothetical protein
VFFILSIVVPVGIAYTASVLWRPVYLSRYLILTLPSLYLVIVWIISTYPARLAALTKFAFIALLCLGLGLEATSASTPVEENFQAVSTYLNEHVRPQDAIIISSPFTIYPIEYYYRGPAVLSTFPVWNRFITGPIPSFKAEEMPKLIDNLQASHDKLYVVLSYDQGYQKQFKDYLDTHLEKVGTQHFSPGLDLYVYKLYYAE